MGLEDRAAMLNEIAMTWAGLIADDSPELQHGIRTM